MSTGFHGLRIKERPYAVNTKPGDEHDAVLLPTHPALIRPEPGESILDAAILLVSSGVAQWGDLIRIADRTASGMTLWDGAIAPGAFALVWTRDLPEDFVGPLPLLVLDIKNDTAVAPNGETSPLHSFLRLPAWLSHRGPSTRITFERDHAAGRIRELALSNTPSTRPERRAMFVLGAMIGALDVLLPCERDTLAVALKTAVKMAAMTGRGISGPLKGRAALAGAAMDTLKNTLDLHNAIGVDRSWGYREHRAGPTLDAFASCCAPDAMALGRAAAEILRTAEPDTAMALRAITERCADDEEPTPDTAGVSSHALLRAKALLGRLAALAA